MFCEHSILLRILYIPCLFFGIVTRGWVGGSLDYQPLFKKGVLTLLLKKVAQIESRMVVVVVLRNNKVKSSTLLNENWSSICALIFALFSLAKIFVPLVPHSL